MSRKQRIQELKAQVAYRNGIIDQQCEVICQLRAELETELLENIKQFQSQCNIASARMRHVCRLANASRSHIERGNYAIADQLLAPLAKGMHDTYRGVYNAPGKF